VIPPDWTEPGAHFRHIFYAEPDSDPEPAPELLLFSRNRISPAPSTAYSQPKSPADDALLALLMLPG
jgi:hypothetical protein